MWTKRVIEHEFGQNKKNLVLALSTDGFNPYRNSNRSIWPIVIQILNLPCRLRNQPSLMMMVGIIPGPTKPKSIQCYLKIIVDELLLLWSNGVSVTDASDNQVCLVKCQLLYTVADYQAHPMINLQSGTGNFHACMKCNLLVSNCCT